MIHGLGRYTWRDGRSYEGNYLNDSKSGFGVFTWVNGNMYRGQWAEGVQHGLGQLTTKDKQNTVKTIYGLWA
jgi:hypothetical protein